MAAQVGLVLLWIFCFFFHRFQYCNGEEKLNLVTDSTKNDTICKNVICPEFSHCVPIHEPIEDYHCECNSDYKGYRCLQKGEFPVVAFFASLGSTTLILSIGFGYLKRKQPSSLITAQLTS